MKKLLPANHLGALDSFTDGTLASPKEQKLKSTLSKSGTVPYGRTVVDAQTTSGVLIQGLFVGDGYLHTGDRFVCRHRLVALSTLQVHSRLLIIGETCTHVVCTLLSNHCLVPLSHLLLMLYSTRLRQGSDCSASGQCLSGAAAALAFL